MSLTMSARAVFRRQDTSRLDVTGWALLGLALLIVVLSLAQSLYRAVVDETMRPAHVSLWLCADPSMPQEADG
jgi:hypothetical protein